MNEFLMFKLAGSRVIMRMLPALREGKMTTCWMNTYTLSTMLGALYHYTHFSFHSTNYERRMLTHVLLVRKTEAQNRGLSHVCGS